MRASLIIFGIIFLVIGGLLYFVPLQKFNVNTTTTGTGGANAQTSSASFTVPIGWSFTAAIIGLVLLILGLVIPGSSRVVRSPELIKVVRGPRGSRGSRGPRGRGLVHKRSGTRNRRRVALPVSTSVTTTTRTGR